MKSALLLIGFVCLSAISAHCEEKFITKSPVGRFEISQEYREDWVEEIRFKNSGLRAVRLQAFPWPGDYSISPDEQWLLRIQKTGSGESAVILYRIEPHGRVSEILGFDDLLWTVSDAASRLEKRDLYHAGISGFSWSHAGDSLDVVLRGSSGSLDGYDMKMRVAYDLASGKAEIQAKGERAGAGDADLLDR